jgi:hypothetical protein
MRKAKTTAMRAEYRRSELGAGVRAKHLAAYRAGTNLVLLSPDVASVFRTDDAVNDALRALVLAAEESVTRARRAGRRAKAAR